MQIITFFLFPYHRRQRYVPVSNEFGCKDTTFFRIYQIPEHYFCVFCYFFCKDTTNRANNQIMSLKNYTSVSKRLNLIRKCDKRQELFVCLQKKMYFCTEFTKARLRRYEYKKRDIARVDGAKLLCFQFHAGCYRVRYKWQNGFQPFGARNCRRTGCR